MKEKQKWFLPVGLYPDQMDKLDLLRDKLFMLGLTTPETIALDKLLFYFKSEDNEAYQDMKWRDNHG